MVQSHHAVSDLSGVSYGREFKAKTQFICHLGYLVEMLLGLHVLINNSKCVLRQIDFSKIISDVVMGPFFHVKGLHRGVGGELSVAYLTGPVSSPSSGGFLSGVMCRTSSLSPFGPMC